ncbi:MAG: histidine kinase, partial [Bacteroidota bacterium]
DKIAGTAGYATFVVAFQLVVIFVRFRVAIVQGDELEGYDEGRVASGTRNFVRYANLPAGKYTFKVWATNSDKVLNESPKVLGITIVPPFYQRWWFYLTCLVVLTGIIYGIFKYRLEQALKVERLRVKISSDLHDDVGGMLSGLAMQTEILELTATEETKPKLARIADLSRSAMSRMRDTVWAIDARKDKLENLVDRMREHAAETLSSRNFQYAIKLDTLDLKKNLATDVRQHLYLIYKEAITNVAKHSRGDTVNVTLSGRRGFTMTIHDNGAVEEKDYKTTGLGLSNMRMRARAIGGELEISTEEGYLLRVRLATW